MDDVEGLEKLTNHVCMTDDDTLGVLRIELTREDHAKRPCLVG